MAIAPKPNVPETRQKKNRFKESRVRLPVMDDEERKKFLFNKGKEYHDMYEQMEKEEKERKEKAEKEGRYYIPHEPKVFVVTRIRGIIGVSPRVRKILQLFRLRQIHNTTFVVVNKRTKKMLHFVEHYVMYGYPTYSTIRKLIFKRGFGRENYRRTRLTDNRVIYKALGQYGVVCIDDLIHQIYTCGPYFKQCNNFLWVFKLTSPRGGFKKKLIHFNEGGDAGNRGEEINSMIKRML